MPVTIRTNTLKYKKSDGTYNGFNAIAQESTDQQIADIQSEGTTQVSAVQTKGAEVLESIPDDYETLSADVSALKSAINVCEDDLGVYSYSETVVNGTVPNPGNANAVAIATFIPATKNDKVKISTTRPLSASDNKYVYYFYEFDQSGTRIKNYDTGILTADEYTVSMDNAAQVKWSILEYTSADVVVPLRKGNFDNYSVIVNVEKANKLSSRVAAMETFFTKEVAFIDDYKVNSNSGNLIADVGYYSYAEISVATVAGATFTGYSNAPTGVNNGLAFYDANGNYISGFNNPTLNVYNWNIIGTIPENAFIMRVSCRTAYKSSFFLNFTWDKTIQDIENGLLEASKTSHKIDLLEKKVSGIIIPELRNGSAGNIANESSVSTKYIYPIDFTKGSIDIEYIGDASLANEYSWGYCLYAGATDGMQSWTAQGDSSITKYIYNSGGEVNATVPRYSVPTAEMAGYDHIMFFLFRWMNGTRVPLRIATDQYNFRLTTSDADEGLQNYSGIDAAETTHNLLYAKHAKGNTGTRLTLVHFSDLHKDTAALARIMRDAEGFEYDDAICTGDMVPGTYEQISSWWNPAVLTCIGNHDSASYNASTGYDWTALSMANRSAYYIEPFKSNWGITHTNGESYYYKDYPDAKVRLIVMDAMLYTNAGTEATAQSSWLENLLADAITNNLHVLIAIHAPHGGATAKECSFSKYEQTIMPTYTDCNTPQTVIDIVATAISNGLHFIGYLVGHTHQDGIWDAENNGKQLMYCITCAAVSNANQWKNSDQHRDKENDAYNIVVIDTTNTLVKLIRGGGANIDDHMRARKAICFNYSTGEIVGEVH